MNFNESKTFRNLVQSIEEEMTARNKYKYYSEVAKKEDLVLIGKVFEKVAHNEAEHSEIFYELLEEHYRYTIVPQPKLEYKMEKTLENLKDAIYDEKEAGENLYKMYSKIAKEEGFEKIAEKFLKISEIEITHMNLFNQLYDHLKNDTLYNKKAVEEWVCMNCGYRTMDKKAPSPCPVCEHVQGWFKIASQKY